MLLARRLQLPVTGIGLPGHFICRHQTSAAEVFVDAFHGGKFMTKADCVQYLVNGNYSLRDDCLAPVSPRRSFFGYVAIYTRSTCNYSGPKIPPACNATSLRSRVR